MVRTPLALRSAAAALAVSLVLFSGLARAQSGSDPTPWRTHALEAHELVRKLEYRPVEKLARLSTEPDASGFDVQKYTIRVDVNFDAKSISATTRVDALATAAGLSSVDLDFVGFQISSVKVDGADAQFSRVADARVLRVALPRAVASGGAFSVEVAYAGQPTTEDGRGFAFTNEGAATFVEPEGARLWYPCKDRPSDKAQYEGFATVPGDQVVASNGRLVEVTDAGGGRKTYHWLETHQIATYLIDFAISDYDVIEDALGDLPIRHYVFPSMHAAAAQDFSRTPEMVRTFQERFGVPFPFDKYGHALFEIGGAMEHQSCTSYGVSLITGDNRYDNIVAHELGHQWFGDLVSPAEWEEIWLNEGFATWTEFVWAEHDYPALRAEVMSNVERVYMEFDGDGDAATRLYDPAQRFGIPVYYKGGWVVAMLRSLLGDEVFFAGLKSYLEDHAYGNVRTSDLRAAMEAASGRDLGPFFDEWVYGKGYPKYETAWSSRAVPGGHWQVDVRVRQTQTTPTVFTYPIEVEAVSADGASERRTLDVTSADVSAGLCFGFEPARVSFDPDNKVLGTVTTSSDAAASLPLACSADAPDPAVLSVAWVSTGSLRVNGTGFVVDDSVVEVNGTALAKTKYPKHFRDADGTATVLVATQKKLKRLVPAGTAVTVTVLNTSNGARSAPVTFTR